MKIFLCSVLLCYYFINMPAYGKVQGKAVAIDGDTIIFIQDKKREKVRLYGVDAPEMSSVLGIYARKYLDELLAKEKDVRCEVKDIDKYKRYVALCYQEDILINTKIIEDGWAVSYRLFIDNEWLPIFLDAEQKASASKKGIWQSDYLNIRWK